MDSMEGSGARGGAAGAGVKPGRINGKNSAYRSGATPVKRRVMNEIVEILEKNRDKGAHKDKRVGYVTQERREKTIIGFFSDLFYLRYTLESVHNLKQKHLVAVFNFLEEEGQSPSTIQGKISIMRTFCEWIGKPGMVVQSTAYVKDKGSVRRSMVATEDKSWEGKGVDAEKVFEEMRGKYPLEAMWLELCLAFGLRVQEAVMLRPNVAHEAESIWLREGTKGDRPRVVPVPIEVKENVLARAKAMANKKTGRLGKPGKTVEQNIQRLYYIMRLFKLTLAKSGVSAHGLRYQYIHYAYKRLTGQEPPVKGGDIAKVDPAVFQVASQKMMEYVGHTRVRIGASYYGSRRPGKRQEKPSGGPDQGAE